MATTKEKLEFIYTMAHHSSVPLGPLTRIMRCASTHGRLAVHHCNGDCPYRHDENGVCWKETRIERQILRELEPYEVSAKFGGDPRGCTVKLTVPDGWTNDWGNEGICVPQ